MAHAPDTVTVRIIRPYPRWVDGVTYAAGTVATVDAALADAWVRDGFAVPASLDVDSYETAAYRPRPKAIRGTETR